MKPKRLRQLIAERLGEFYRRRMQRLEGLRLKQVLRRKNPYLYRALGTQNATELVQGILLAYISSSDEAIFGNCFFEPIAKAVSDGVVSPTEGVDVVIETDDTYKAIAVKSGPNPFNASQKRRQHTEFMALRSRVRKLGKQFDAILGHAYGRLKTEPSRSQIYRDLSGEAFWDELTGDPDFYLKLVRLMEEDIIRRHRQEYEAAWQKAVNRYVREFTVEFCDDEGAIDWEALLRINSGTTS